MRKRRINLDRLRMTKTARREIDAALREVENQAALNVTPEWAIPQPIPRPKAGEGEIHGWAANEYHITQGTVGSALSEVWVDCSYVYHRPPREGVPAHERGGTRSTRVDVYASPADALRAARARAERAMGERLRAVDIQIALELAKEASDA